VSSSSPLWRRAYDLADKAVTPRAESFVRTPTFAQGAALLQRAQAIARGAARDLTARAWHLVNLPAGSDISRLRAQVGALDREVRRLTLQLENERRRHEREEPHAPRPQPADRPGTRAPRRRAQRPPGT
jgi:hypothetical protein